MKTRLRTGLARRAVERATKETTPALGCNPYVFLVGCARSGTTLLQRMVDAHPHMAIIGETRWIPGWFEKQTRPTQGLVTPELIPRLLVHDKFPQLKIGREDLERLLASAGPIPYASFLGGIFDLYGTARGKRLVGSKASAYVRKLPALHGLWPGARFVHLIRDGRDVCLSIRDWAKAGRTAGVFATWTEDYVSTTALWWERTVRLGREAGSSLGSDLYYELRYESLVGQPADECAALCAFLGVPYDDAMPQFHLGRTRTDPGLDAKRAWLPITSRLRDWRTQMPAEDVERFEAVAGGLLDELGYPRAVPCPAPETLEHAARIRQVFAEDARSQNLQLPARW